MSRSTPGNLAPFLAEGETIHGDFKLGDGWAFATDRRLLKVLFSGGEVRSLVGVPYGHVSRTVLEVGAGAMSWLGTGLVILVLAAVLSLAPLGPLFRLAMLLAPAPVYIVLIAYGLYVYFGGVYRLSVYTGGLVAMKLEGRGEQVQSVFRVLQRQAKPSSG